eukprot:scaffold8708_cov157-Skeletonema_marinoi.AAC.8
MAHIMTPVLANTRQHTRTHEPINRPIQCSADEMRGCTPQKYEMLLSGSFMCPAGNVYPGEETGLNINRESYHFTKKSQAQIQCKKCSVIVSRENV